MLLEKQVARNLEHQHIGLVHREASKEAARNFVSDESKKSELTRREAAIGAGVAVATLAMASGSAASNSASDKTRTTATQRMPVAFVPHGGGPWPFVDMGGFLTPREFASLKQYLVDLPKALPSRPKALLVISAHWEEQVPTVMTSKTPPMFYDYGGFPPEAYTLEWPAPGDPALASRVVSLLGAGDISAKTDSARGFDHGTFIPFKVSWPDADVPTVQLSIKSNYDPAEHLAIGRALAPLRDEGVLILGSGMSFHNLRSFRSGTARKDSVLFDGWLKKAATASPETRTRLLTEWASAPGARLAHPDEDHLIPLMVVAGAAGADVGRVTYEDEFGGARLAAFHYG